MRTEEQIHDNESEPVKDGFRARISARESMRRRISARESMRRTGKLFFDEPVSEDKLASVLENLPPEIQAELVQMVRNNPSIARVLVANLPGAKHQIIKAVQVGKEMGAQAKGKTPVRVIYKLNKYGEPVLVLPKVAQVRLSTYFPGVHQDFLPIALGAHHNVAGHYGDEHELLGEHHEHEGDEHNPHHGHVAALLEQQHPPIAERANER
jgi:hypothetical protein